MFHDRRFRGAAAAAAVILAILIGSAVSQQRTAVSPRQPQAIEHAESLSTAFRLAANRVLPTVVKIKSTVNERRIALPGRNGENPFRGTPFEDFFVEPFQQRIPRREGMGSGVIIDSDGVILTNNHVVREADQVVVELLDGREFRATEIRTDPQTDLAIVRIAGAGTLPTAELGDSTNAEIGDWVLAIGNPFELEASVSAGIISAKGRSLSSGQRTSYLQTDAAINPGNSGGPLVNLKGQVVGINTAIASSSGGYQGIGFAIPVDLAKWVTEQLISSGSVRRAWLGVGISDLSHESTEVLDIDPRVRGVLVSQVNEGSPAERAGLQPGDVITQFAGQPVTGSSQLQRAVERAPLETRQQVRVIRRGRELDLTVVTEALPNAETLESPGDEPADQDAMANAELGLEVVDLTRELARRLDLPLDTRGVVIINVAPNGIARTSNVERGMVIVEINGKAVESVADFEGIVQQADVKKGVTMIVKRRGGDTMFLILRQR